MRDPGWTPVELARLSELGSPAAVQDFLDSIPYSLDPVYRCPRSVLRDGRAHCFDGAVFAAAALAAYGHRPLIFELKAVRDDDHVLAAFQADGHWGAVGKSNCAGLRFREPVFRTRRELVMSYFELYFNVESEKTLRSYSALLDLDRSIGGGWRLEDGCMARIAAHLDRLRHHPVVTPAMVRRLAPVDSRSYAAGMLGSDERGLFRPGPAGDGD